MTGSSKRIGASIVKNLHASGVDIGIHYNSSKTEASDLSNELNVIRPNSTSIFNANITNTDGETSRVNAIGIRFQSNW